MLQFRIGQKEIRRRDHVQHLARCELDNVFMLFGDPAHADRGVVPPLLLEQKALIVHVVRPFLPRLAGKPVVLRQGFDAWASSTRGGSCCREVTAQTRGFSQRLVDELHAFARRHCQMRRPVHIRSGQGSWRKPTRVACNGCVQCPIEGVPKYLNICRQITV